MAHHFGGFFVQTLQPLTQRPQRPFYIGMFGSQGELWADDKVCGEHWLFGARISRKSAYLKYRS